MTESEMARELILDDPGSAAPREIVGFLRLPLGRKVHAVTIHHGRPLRAMCHVPGWSRWREGEILAEITCEQCLLAYPRRLRRGIAVTLRRTEAAMEAAEVLRGELEEAHARVRRGGEARAVLEEVLAALPKHPAERTPAPRGSPNGPGGAWC